MATPAAPPTRTLGRLLWILPHPTPYNTYLLNGLASRLDVRIEALYRWETMPSHPWTSLPERKFSWRIASEPGGRDRELERAAAGDEATLMVFAGWRNRTMLRPLTARLRRGLPYAFWSDTPKSATGLFRKLNNQAFRHFARRAVTTLATGTPAVERYREMGVPAEKLDSFPFVVDPEHFSPPEQGAGGDTSRPARFLITGRLVAKLKGQAVAIEALAIATRTSSQSLGLVLAGTGPDEAPLRDQAARLGLGDVVHFRGWTEYDRLPALLWQSSALVLPSYWDPYPVAVLEGMAAGRPVLGSRACGSVRERVVHGKTGFIHEPGDAASLAEHMTWIAKNPTDAAQIGAQALGASKVWGIEAAASVVRDMITKASRR